MYIITGEGDETSLTFQVEEIENIASTIELTFFSNIIISELLKVSCSLRKLFYDQFVVIPLLGQSF